MQGVRITMSSSALFFQDQIPLIREAILHGYSDYLKFMLGPYKLLWPTANDYNWFLALSYEALWDAHQHHLNWTDNI
jgi:hypothetical protein